jgi:hypothetical protein
MSRGVPVVYVPLLNEGTSVVRPTQGVKIGDNVYRILATRDYDPTDEQWEFPPGSIVECTLEMRGGQEILVARKKAHTT